MTFDGLTQIHNKRVFDDALEREVSRSLATAARSRSSSSTSTTSSASTTRAATSPATPFCASSPPRRRRLRREDISPASAARSSACILPRWPEGRRLGRREAPRASSSATPCRFEERRFPITSSFGVASSRSDAQMGATSSTSGRRAPLRREARWPEPRRLARRASGRGHGAPSVAAPSFPGRGDLAAIPVAGRGDTPGRSPAGPRGRDPQPRAPRALSPARASSWARSSWLRQWRGLIASARSHGRSARSLSPRSRAATSWVAEVPVAASRSMRSAGPPRPLPSRGRGRRAP